jgi:hypothetical protein
VESVPITTPANVVSSNPAHGEMYFDTTLCDKVCLSVAAGLWFSPGTPVYSKTKTYCHVIIEILLKVELNTITPSIFFHCLRHDSIKSAHLKSYDCPHVD